MERAHGSQATEQMQGREGWSDEAVREAIGEWRIAELMRIPRYELRRRVDVLIGEHKDAHAGIDD